MTKDELERVQAALSRASVAMSEVEHFLRYSDDVPATQSSIALQIWNEVIDLKEELYEDHGIV